MLSVCIPVYNFDVRDLVETLHQQLENSAIVYEIIVNDDNSSADFKEKNRVISDLSYVKLIEQTQNLGRAKNRNFMIGVSIYEFLLFIDADAKVVTKDFVLKYVEQCKSETVVCGTVAYEKNPPTIKEHYFRYWYGINREMREAIQRNINPYQSFSTFNVLFHKSIFSKIKFDETLKLYGHEDTLMGFQLKKLGIPIVHIDNPLIHNNLEDSKVFLKKTETAIHNLVLIHEGLNKDLEFVEDVKLLRTYLRCKRLKINGLVALLFRVTKKRLNHYLLGKQPNLFWFDVYKLGYLCSIYH